MELQDEDAQVDWLIRKAKECGFAMLDVRSVPDVLDLRAAAEGKLKGWRRTTSFSSASPQRLTFGSVVFEGRLRITDADVFRLALARGIGPGKAYGFGLLSIAGGT